jgi:two-component system, NtrC family, sensor kinase
MARNTGRTGKQTAGSRARPRARKSGEAKAGVSRSRKPKPAKSAGRKTKPAPSSELARLKRWLKTARLQQEGSAEILRAVANAAGDAAGPLQLIAETTARLFGAASVSIQLAEGHAFTQEYRVGAVAKRIGSAYPRSNIRVGGRNLPGTVVAENRQIHIPDLDHLDPAMSDFPGLPHARAGGARTVAGTPLRREGKAIGALIIFRDRLMPFSDDELVLQQSFADQAVIAIQNARLFNQTQEALERQTATADILKVIASSPSDVRPVFEAIAARAKSLVGGFSATVFRFIDGIAHLEAFTPTSPEADDILRSTFPRPARDFAPFRMTHAGEVMQILDTEALTDEILDISRARGFRSMVFAPLMNKGMSIGFIAVTRIQPGAFTDHHVQLLRTFADQAVIAIENARLFDEVQAKTHDLEESLQQQTATADALNVISRAGFDLDAVMDTLAKSARELCAAELASLFLREEETLVCRGIASLDPAYREVLRKALPIPLDEQTPMGRAVLTGKIANIGNFEQNPHTRLLTFQQELGFKAFLAVPLLREQRGVGVFILTRFEMGKFKPRQVELVQTFADQAVIAIENVRLFDEVQSRTRELSQSLEDLRAAQDRLVQTEKLASLGQLTAGIAHEIKNPLNFVNNFSALSVELADELNDVLKQSELAEKVRQEVDELTEMLKSNLEKVVQHGKRADSIIKNMLLHSREGSGERQTTDINALVGESLNLAYHGARAEKAGFNVTLRQDLDPDAGALDVYPQEMTRALLNLISNGFYAATRRKADANDGAFEPMLSAATRNLGKTVEIRIRDNGTGIPPEVGEKIFNPFFTTKPTGEGTGLGLSMTHDIIVKQHGGRIDVETGLGEFTEFIITLPRDDRLA